MFHRDVDASGHVHEDDFVTETRRWHAREVEKHLRNRWDVEVWTCGNTNIEGGPMGSSTRETISNKRWNKNFTI